MAKAINWPLPFRDEVLAEDCEQEHKKVRMGRVVGDLRQCAIHALSAEDFSRLKKPLQTPQAVIDFLTTTYNQPVDENTLVTIVTYQNHPVIPEDIEI
jgi:hypothetical protein